MKIMRKIIEIDDERCDGCGQCVPGCAEGALEIVDGKARIVEDKYCDGLGACIGDCPQGALKIVEREAEDFDEAAVEAFLAEKEKAEKAKAAKRPELMACGCPSTQIQTFVPASARKDTNKPAVQKDSALSHWPIQIKLIPPTAPFLKNAELLVLADCCAVAYASLHDMLKDKVVMMGCPKFDDAEEYVQKFAAIFKAASIRSVTNMYMEVPCCSGLPLIVEKGMAAAGVNVPSRSLIVGRQGEISEEEAN